MTDDLEHAREGVAALTDAACPVDQMDTSLARLEEAVRLSERIAVVERLRARDWLRGSTIDLDTLDVVVDSILEADGDA